MRYARAAPLPPAPAYIYTRTYEGKEDGYAAHIYTLPSRRKTATYHQAAAAETQGHQAAAAVPRSAADTEAPRRQAEAQRYKSVGVLPMPSTRAFCCRCLEASKKKTMVFTTFTGEN